jgi:hypothetical protein
MTQDASNSGYGASAEALIAQYESITFEQVHGPVLRYFPAAPRHRARHRGWHGS